MSQPFLVRPAQVPPSWSLDVLHFDCLGEPDEFGIYSTDKRSGASADFHNALAKGPALRELEAQPLHLANWEGPLYRSALESLVAGIPISGPAFDAGCGDGRFTCWLLENGANQIVAFDQHYGSLASLRSHLCSINRQDDVILVHGDLRDAPLKSKSFEFGLAIGVLYYLSAEFESGLSVLSDALKPNGVLIDSEPSLASAALLALLFEGVDDFIDVIKDRGWIERHGNTRASFRSFSDLELKKIYGAAGLHEAERHPLSLLPLILRILQVRGSIDESHLIKRELEIRAAFSLLDGTAQAAGLTLRKLIKTSE